MRPVWRSPNAGPWRAAALVTVAWLLLCFPYFEKTRNANELPRIVQSVALVEEGSFAVDGPVRRWAGPTGDLGPDLSRSPTSGRLYPNKPPGVSLLGAAAYVLARAVHGDGLTLRALTWWVRLFTGVLPLGLMVGVLVRRWGSAPRPGAAAVLAGLSWVVLGSPLAAYGHLAYGHALSAALLTCGISLLGGSIERGAPGGAFWGGLLAGAAVGVEYGAVFAALPIAWGLWRGLSRPAGWRVLVLSLYGAAVPVGLLALYHHVVFGTPWTTGYHAVTNPAFAAKHAQGLLGLSLPTWPGFVRHVLDPGTGIVAWFPLLPVALVGLLLVARRPGPLRAEAGMFLGVGLVYLLVVSSLVFDGGWRVGPRYLVVALPGLALGLAAAAGWSRDRPWAQVLLAAGATYGLVASGLAANLWPHIDPTHVHQPVAELLLPLWRAGVQPYGVPDGPTLAVASALALGLGTYGRAVGWRGRRWLIAVAGLAVGLLAVWSTTQVSPHPRSAANLSYVQRVWEPAPPHD